MILGNMELFAAMLKTAVGVLILTAWGYLALEQRTLRRQLRSTRQRVHQHHRALVHLQGLTAAQATSTGQPMATVTRLRPPSLLAPAPAPAAVSEIEQALAGAGRALTGVELADALDRKPWDLLPDLDRLLKSGRVEPVGGHTLGRTAYQLADPTLRLPGAVTHG